MNLQEKLKSNFSPPFFVFKYASREVLGAISKYCHALKRKKEEDSSCKVAEFCGVSRETCSSFISVYRMRLSGFAEVDDQLLCSQKHDHQGHQGEGADVRINTEANSLGSLKIQFAFLLSPALQQKLKALLRHKQGGREEKRLVNS